MNEPAYQKLASMVSYNPDNGLFHYVAGRNRGKLAGTTNFFGYTRLSTRIDGKRHDVSGLRLAVYMMHKNGLAPPLTTNTTVRLTTQDRSSCVWDHIQIFTEEE